MAEGTGIAESKVSRIVWHGVFTCNTQSCIAEAEIAVGCNFTGDIHQRVSFPIGGTGIQGVIQQHIFIQGIVLWRSGLLGVREVNRSGQFSFFRKEASQIECSGETILIIVVQPALADALFQSAETGCFHVTGQVDTADIGKL